MTAATVDIIADSRTRALREVIEAAARAGLEPASVASSAAPFEAMPVLRFDSWRHLAAWGEFGLVDISRDDRESWVIDGDVWCVGYVRPQDAMRWNVLVTWPLTVDVPEPFADLRPPPRRTPGATLADNPVPQRGDFPVHVVQRSTEAAGVTA